MHGLKNEEHSKRTYIENKVVDDSRGRSLCANIKDGSVKKIKQLAAELTNQDNDDRGNQVNHQSGKGTSEWLVAGQDLAKRQDTLVANRKRKIRPAQSTNTKQADALLWQVLGSLDSERTSP